MNQMSRNHCSCNQRNLQQPVKRNRQSEPAERISAPSCTHKNNNPHETMNRMQLLNHINEVSFARDEILLYLDTHPCDQDALAYSREMIAIRDDALRVYARRFGPLTVDTTIDNDCDHWEWVMQPWPWEPQPKGGCR